MSSLADALLPPSTASYNAPPSPKYDTGLSEGGSINEDEEDNANYTSGPVEQDEEMEDLFGNDEGVEEATKPEEDALSSAAQSRQDSERLTSPEREHRQALEYGEDEELAEDAVVVREANVAFPNIPVPHSSDGNNWVIRMPNYVHVDAKPFDPEYYYGPEYEEDGTQSSMNREKSMSIKLKVENTIRWRWTKDEFGNYKKKTNSRIIRWSDGSLSLRLGKELFDINQSIDTSATIPRSLGTSGSLGSISQSQSQSQFIPPSLSQSTSQPTIDVNSTAKPQGLTYLVAQHKRAQVLQSEAVITGYMTLRPTGMQSDTHRMLVKAVGQKHNKVARLRMAADPTVDPEKEIQDLARATARKSKKRMEDSSGRKRRRGQRRRAAGMYSDDEDDEGAAYGDGYDEEDEEGGEAGGSPERRKGGRGPSREEEGGGGGYQEDDFLVADDSSEDGSEGNGARKKKRSELDRMEDDDLDKLEEKLAEQEKAKQRQHTDDGQGADEDGMEIESEEEEDGEQIRRVGASSGGRKRRALEFDDFNEE